MHVVSSRHPPGAVCMVSGELTRYAPAMQSMMALKVPEGSVTAWFTGVLIAKSLNSALQVVANNAALQWAWIMGDDHTFASDVLMELLDRELDVVAPLCLHRMPPLDPVIVEHGHPAGPRPKPLGSLPAGGLYKLAHDETCGDAGMLVRRSVLEKIGPPWYDHRQSGSLNAEDQAFVQRIKDAGVDVWVDLDCCIGHIGPVVFMPVRGDEGWCVRMMAAGRHVADLAQVPRL